MNQRFEDYIKDYNSNFSEISKCANSKGIVAKYYSSTKGRYKKFFDEKDNFDIEKFAIRYYRAKKEMYILLKCLLKQKEIKRLVVL